MRSLRWPRLLGVLLSVLALAVFADVVRAAHPAVTRGDAAAVAAAISLRHSDLPSTREVPNPSTGQSRRLSAQFAACAGTVPESGTLASSESAAFVNAARSFAAISDAEILPSVSLVSRDFAAANQPRTLSCLLRTEEAVARLGAGTKIIAAHVVRLMPRIAGSDGAWGARVNMRISVSNGTTSLRRTVYFDFVGFAFGQAEVTLELQSAPNAPVASVEHHLTSLLLVRASKAVR